MQAVMTFLLTRPLAGAGGGSVLAGGRQRAGGRPRPLGLALPGRGADTVRTNLWLTEALMGEIVATRPGCLPAGRRRPCCWWPERRRPSDDLFGTVAAGVLRGPATTLYLADEDSPAGGRWTTSTDYQVVESS